MAELRLIAASLVCAAACRASEAGPTSGLTPPAGWRALPEMASAAKDAAMTAKLAVAGAEAWGEPARGCYATWLAWIGDRGPIDTLADKMLATVSTEPALAGITVTETVLPAKGSASGVASLAFAKAPYHGRVRIQLGRTGSYALLACFWNAREPAACEAACAPLLGGLK